MFIPYSDYDESYSWDPRPWHERPAEGEPEPEEPPLIPLAYFGRRTALFLAAMHWRRRALAAEARLAMYDAREKTYTRTTPKKEGRP